MTVYRRRRDELEVCCCVLREKSHGPQFTVLVYARHVEKERIRQDYWLQKMETYLDKRKSYFDSWAGKEKMRSDEHQRRMKRHGCPRGPRESGSEAPERQNCSPLLSAPGQAAHILEVSLLVVS